MKAEEKKTKIYLLKNIYLDMIRPYLRDMINNHKTLLKILWVKYLIIIFMENGKFS